MSIETASGRLVVAPKSWDYGRVHLRPTDLTVERCAWCPAEAWPALKGRERYLDRICANHRLVLALQYQFVRSGRPT